MKAWCRRATLMGSSPRRQRWPLARRSYQLPISQKCLSMTIRPEAVLRHRTMKGNLRLRRRRAPRGVMSSGETRSFEPLEHVSVIQVKKWNSRPMIQVVPGANKTSVAYLGQMVRIERHTECGYSEIALNLGGRFWPWSSSSVAQGEEPPRVPWRGRILVAIHTRDTELRHLVVTRHTRTTRALYNRGVCRPSVVAVYSWSDLFQKAASNRLPATIWPTNPTSLKKTFASLRQ